ncbi:MAG: TetR/AcrR family transcriptional regulator C-terminal domain-containing protein [Eubacterium sp.]|nr:TetR/AcrR family transcriptional regulator C-terminal domain-containing protein [Eubacterium sp.]
MAKRDTKELIMNSFKELAKTKSIDELTVREISYNCGITPQTFYKYYSDKFDLVFSGYRERVDMIFNEYKDGEITWKEVISLYIVGFRENSKFIIDAFNKMKGQDSYIDRTTAYIVKNIKSCLMKKKNIDKIPDEYDYIIGFYAGGITYAIRKWLESGMTITEDEFTDYLASSVPKKLMDYYNEDCEPE